eukprot:TRINITY_DN20374_c0_g1::TRINITY_DN20374_c0_g1_i1::g.8432::m.8432 TRINITY_DN20374_c0_g1::TRINITY_DN20374_c0_g1_i1::g.8432  ORF type:complete len:364 (+),score=46.20,sp/Q86HN8/MCFY_DICDI/36.39/1e-62,Mito_carr/PF00153.22/5.6e+02,Mito_carr/PF00153.22/2.8e-19,Mito_carr/PF00153.22/1.6e-21,Mito_carr/PF00153.22/1.6e-24,Acyl-CoA_dh_1/PF00441.19/1.6e+02,Acyl-CoA_dh_1/PF00441.19/1.7,Acyl-CoA_dh_1/PF00441.19/2e+03 TRINITY_DN20374_c0_g1_i1:84-1175(+)
MTNEIDVDHHGHHHREHTLREQEEEFLSGAFAGLARAFARSFTRVVVGVGRGTIAGSVAGMAEETTGYPLDLVKTRMQVATTHASAIQVFRELLKHEGIGGVFRGLGAPLISSAFANSLLFGAFGQAQSFLEDTAVPEHYRPFASGAFAGMAQSFILCPVDVVKSRMQLHGVGHGHGGGAAASASASVEKITTSSVVREVWRNHGLRGMYHGLAPTLWRDVPGYAVFFGAYESLKLAAGVHGGHGASPEPAHHNADDGTETGNAASGGSDGLKVIMCGGVAGMLYHSSTYPFDVVKTMMQIQSMNPAVANPPFTGMFSCLRFMAKEYGVSSLYKGFGPTVVRAFPANAAGFLVYEMTIKFMPS